METDELKYTAEGLIGAAVMAAEWANAVFYCEDAGFETVYKRLLRKLAPRLKPFEVICTGGKSICKRLAKGRTSIPVPVVIIVDKDFDDLRGDYNSNAEAGMVYLRKYSLENYLCQTQAFLEVSIEELAKDRQKLHPRNIEDEVADKAEYVRVVALHLVEIARYFVLAQKFKLEISNCKTPGIHLFPDDAGTFPLPSDWFETFKATFANVAAGSAPWLLENGELDRQLAEAFAAKCKPWGDFPDVEHLVGKHFLYALRSYFDVRLKTKFLKMSDRELYLRLLNHIVLDEFNFLRDAIYESLAGTQALNA